MTRYLPLVVGICLLAPACTSGRAVSVLPTGLGAGGAGVISAGGGNVISAGGGNLVASGAKAPTEAANAFGVPTTVRLQMPSSLDGTGVVSAGGANYHVRAVPAPDALAKGVLDNTRVYVDTTTLVDGILKGVAQLRLLPGKSFTFPDPADRRRNLTVLLEVKSDHAVINVGVGKTAKGPDQIFAISYTSARKGHAVFHVEDGKDGRLYLSTHFDLDAETASADAAIDTTRLSRGEPKQTVGHWEFKRRSGATADGSAFEMAGSVFQHHAERPEDDGVLAFAANFLSGGSGAFIFGARSQGTGDRFVFLPRDGVSYFANPPRTHDFYMTPEGRDLPQAEAGAKLRAIVPADTAIYEPFPENPSTHDPFTDSRFAFPE